jgi:hypothetical protein
VTGADVRQALSKFVISRSDNLCALAELLDLDEGNAALSYAFIVDNLIHRGLWKDPVGIE